MFLKYKCLIILLLFLTGNMMTEAQELIAPTDTVMAVVGDTVVSAGQDSVLALDSVPKKQTGLDAPVSYQAKDSIIMTGANWAYLFGESDVKYQQIELQSEKIDLRIQPFQHLPAFRNLFWFFFLRINMINQDCICMFNLIYIKFSQS